MKLVDKYDPHDVEGFIYHRKDKGGIRYADICNVQHSH